MKNLYRAGILASVLAALTCSPALAKVDFTAYADGKEIRNNDFISSRPKIEIIVVTSETISTSSYVFGIDMSPLSGSDFSKLNANTYMLTYEVTTALTNDAHSIGLQVTGASTNDYTFFVTGLLVRTGEAPQLRGAPLNYPNPFSASTGTSIAYTLTRDSDVRINIYDLSAGLVWSGAYLSGSNGGSTGYNEVFWNGRTASGVPAGNGMYVYMVMVNGSVAAKGKMVVVN